MPTKFENPVTGLWPWSHYPDVITWERRELRKAKLKQPYEGVVEQYRETVETDSHHLKVKDDGTWVVDHTDDANPDMDRVAEHFFRDVPLGQGIVVVGVAALFVGGAVLAVKAIGALARA